MGPADERALARKLLADELRRLAADAYADGREPLDEATEDAIATAVPDRLHGLARLQPLLDDPSIRDIHISGANRVRSEEHTSELQSLMRTSYAVFCLKTKKLT